MHRMSNVRSVRNMYSMSSVHSVHSMYRRFVVSNVQHIQHAAHVRRFRHYPNNKREREKVWLTSINRHLPTKTMVVRRPRMRKQRPSRKKKKLIVGVIVVVIVVLAVAFWKWHEQPTFCNSVCHTPMDSYVESYYQNNVASLASVHGKAGVTCLTCHPAKIDEQINEVTKWISGHYAYDKETGKLLSHSAKYATPETCLRSGCHNMTLADLEKKTKNIPWNPHAFSQHGVTNCGDCHKAHEQSVMICSECHRPAAEHVPEGWAALPYRPDHEATIPFHAKG